MIKPCFVVGTNRSGTTWLGNLLASHPDVAAITHPAHRGIHESAYFTHVYNRYGDLSKISSFLEFTEAIGASDYFRISGISKEEIRQLYPSDYSDIFRHVMDSFSRKQHKSFWVEKSPLHALTLDLISNVYPDAVFVGIQRDVFDVVKSSLGLRIQYDTKRSKNKKLRRLTLKDAIRNYYAVNKAIDRFKKQHPEKIYVCTFEALKSNKEEVLLEIQKFIGLTPKGLESNFEGNSSFQGEKTHWQLTKSEIRLIKRNALIMKRLPYIYFHFKRNLREKLRARFSAFQNPRLPEWFYKLHSLEETKP